MITIKEIINNINVKKAHIVNENLEIYEFCYDSRKLISYKETVFFAIVSERNNGHNYIQDIINKGVNSFIISEPVENYLHYQNINFIEVKDAVCALQEIAVYHRSKFSYPVIGITGSNGKTIVKEWISQMIKPLFHVVKSTNSFNSQIGVPVSVLKMKEENNLAIFEAGISKPDEMANLEKIIKPTIGIITNIGEIHSKNFSSIQEKLEEKLLLFVNSETLIYCYDNLLIKEELEKKFYENIHKISWGKDDNATYKISNIALRENGVDCIINNDLFFIPFKDRASIENAIHSIIVLKLLKIDSRYINDKLSQLVSVEQRFEFLEGQNGSVIINDTYSLDTTSLKVVLDILASQTQKNRKTVILSDIEHIDHFQNSDYQELNSLFKAANITRLILVGETVYENSNFFSGYETIAYKSTESFINDIDNIVFFNEAILIKGARSFKFEKIVSKLQLLTHQTILSVNLSAIINNLNYFRSKLHPDTKIIAIVKAMCYGLGYEGLIEELAYHGIDYFAVAYSYEGIMLRKRNISNHIIILGAESQSFEEMIKYNLEPEIFNMPSLKLFDEILNQHDEIESFDIHIKLDSGMHRLGFEYGDLDELLSIVKSSKKMKISSVFSHLASAENANDDDFTKYQLSLFEKMSSYIMDKLNYHILRHVLNSSGIIRFPQAQYDMVRLGLGIYGFSLIEDVNREIQKSVILKTTITQLKKVNKGDSVGYNRCYLAEKDKTIAVIPIGYADGYFRAFGNGVGKVEVNGQLATVVGTISMDMTSIDVTGIDAKTGDEVIVYGSSVDINNAAKSINTIPYELLTAISKRVKRVYVKE